MDWKSSLEALRSAMPEEENQQESLPETNTANPKAEFAAQAERLEIILDRKGRKGKAATIIAGFTIDDSMIEDIAKRLKQRLGVGGSARGGEILIQGDKRREVAEALETLGLKAVVR